MPGLSVAACVSRLTYPPAPAVVIVGAGLATLAVAMLALACTTGFVGTAVAWGEQAAHDPALLDTRGTT